MLCKTKLDLLNLPQERYLENQQKKQKYVNPVAIRTVYFNDYSASRFAAMIF